MHLAVMIGASRQSRHDIQTQSLTQILQHLTDVGESVVRQLRQLRAVVRRRWSYISHLTMPIGGRFQHCISERVRVVHTEQGHLPVR